MEIEWKVRADSFAGRPIVFLEGRTKNYSMRLAHWVEEIEQARYPQDAFVSLMNRIEYALAEAELAGRPANAFRLA